MIDAMDETEKAADELRDTISMKLGDLADRILGRPEFGSDEWRKYRNALAAGDPAARANLCEWHLTKIEIATCARIDPTGDVLNAREQGATWSSIATRTGTTRQAAYARWGHVDQEEVQNDE